MVVACLALLVALGGTSVAAISQLPRASVGTPQLKRNAVTAQKINPNAVRTGHVLNGSLLSEDVRAPLRGLSADERAELDAWHESRLASTA